MHLTESVGKCGRSPTRRQAVSTARRRRKFFWEVRLTSDFLIGMDIYYWVGHFTRRRQPNCSVFLDCEVGVQSGVLSDLGGLDRVNGLSQAIQVNFSDRAQGLSSQSCVQHGPLPTRLARYEVWMLWDAL